MLRAPVRLDFDPKDVGRKPAKGAQVYAYTAADVDGAPALESIAGSLPDHRPSPLLSRPPRQGGNAPLRDQGIRNQGIRRLAYHLVSCFPDSLIPDSPIPQFPVSPIPCFPDSLTPYFTPTCNATVPSINIW